MIVSCPLLVLGRVYNSDEEEIGAAATKAGLLKCGGRKNLPLLYDLYKLLTRILLLSELISMP